jgi:hypothetical protein
MCLELVVRHECGCLIKTTQVVQICINYQLVEDLKALGYPESDDELRYCRDVCKAESKQQYAKLSGRCNSCNGATEVKEWDAMGRK